MSEKEENTANKKYSSEPAEENMQGHWLLASLGKKVLRPGGLALTKKMLAAAKPSSEDHIVELGPGVGHTAKTLLAAQPVKYTAVDPNPEGRAQLSKIIANNPKADLIIADANNTTLADGSADLVIGEAMLTMQSAAGKAKIANEVFRILVPGGRYGIHELAVKSATDDDPCSVSDDETKKVAQELSKAIKVGAKPVPVSEWKKILEDAGFEIVYVATAPMRLLEPSRLIADEGFFGALRFAKNMIKNKPARERVLQMKRTFRERKDELAAVAIVAVKPKAK